MLVWQVNATLSTYLQGRGSLARQHLFEGPFRHVVHNSIAFVPGAMDVAEGMAGGMEACWRRWACVLPHTVRVRWMTSTMVTLPGFRASPPASATYTCSCSWNMGPEPLPGTAGVNMFASPLGSRPTIFATPPRNTLPALVATELIESNLGRAKHRFTVSPGSFRGDGNAYLQRWGPMCIGRDDTPPPRFL